MLPFNDPNLQQGMMFNPNFNSQNAILGNLNGGNLNNFHGLNPNLQPMAQNNQLGVLQLLAAQIQSNPQLQINLLHQLQSQNLAPPFPQGGMPYLGPNPNQMMGVPNSNGQFLAMNQILQGNQMMGLLGNPHLGQNNMGSGFGNAPSTMGHNPVYGSPGASLKSKQPLMSSSPKKTQWNKMNSRHAIGSQQFQVNHVEAKITDNSHVDAQNSASKGSARNFRFGKEPSHNRFQKSQLHDMKSSKRYMKQRNKRGGRGQHDWREQKSQSTISGEEASTVCRRSIPLNYTNTEIKLWREARKRNFPTTANVNKKLVSHSENNEDADSKLRRQQLKEVLAKQAELGVEVAEIPPSYICEPDEPVTKKENVKVTDGPSANKFDRKRGRGHGWDNRHFNRHDRDNWHSKRQTFRNKAALTSPPPVKREPSLLEKLLSADVKRDKSRLLQVFRFMVLNDFFKQWPAKPLEFPVITVKDDELCEDEIVGEANPSLDRAHSPANEALKKTTVEGIDSQKESIAAEEMDYESGEEDNVDSNEVPDDTIEEEDRTAEQIELEEGEITD